MKFLYSHRTRSADGQYVHIRELTRALSARGHEIMLAGPDDGTSSTKPLSAGDGNGGLKSLLPRAAYECAEYGYSIPAYRRLVARARNEAPDVIYERYNLFYYAGVWAKKKLGIPLILEVNAPLAEERARHGGLSLEKLARSSEAAIWRAADHVLPVTDVLADYVRDAGVPGNRITVIQNGVGDEFLNAADPFSIVRRYGLQDKIVLGFTGFVREWHGVDRVIRFMASSGRGDLHLLLVGDGPARAGLEKLAAECGVADRVTVTGVVQRASMADHVAAFDIALQPAVTAYASPLKLFEYMAQARTIMAPASANICEILTDGEDALLFEENSASAFDGALSRLVEDNDLRLRLGAAARARLLRDDRTWSANASRVEAIAVDLVGKII